MSHWVLGTDRRIVISTPARTGAGETPALDRRPCTRYRLRNARGVWGPCAASITVWLRIREAGWGAPSSDQVFCAIHVDVPQTTNFC